MSITGFQIPGNLTVGLDCDCDLNQVGRGREGIAQPTVS